MISKSKTERLPHAGHASWVCSCLVGSPLCATTTAGPKHYNHNKIQMIGHRRRLHNSKVLVQTLTDPRCSCAIFTLDIVNVHVRVIC